MTGSWNQLKFHARYINKKYLDLEPGEMLRAAGIDRYEINDPDHWFTQSQFDVFYEAGVRLTGDVNLAREAGRGWCFSLHK